MNNFLKITYSTFCLLFLFSCEKEVPPQSVSLEGGESYEFSSSYPAQSSELVWDMGDGTILYERAPTYSYDVAGTYWVSYSEYSKSGRFKRKRTSHKVLVTKAKKPRITSIDIFSVIYDNGFPDEYEYIYEGLETKIRMEVDEDSNDEDSTSYEIYVEGQLIDTSRWTEYTFVDTGRYEVSFKVTDKFGGSKTKDTNIIVGGDATRLNFTIPDVLSGQIGTVSEKYLIINDDDYYFNNVRSYIENYQGPSNTSLISNGEMCNYYGTGSNQFIYSSMGELNYISLGTINNGMQPSITFPAYDDISDIDEVYAVAVIVGDNGMAYGYVPAIDIYPGIEQINTVEINMSFEGY